MALGVELGDAAGQHRLARRARADQHDRQRAHGVRDGLRDLLGALHLASDHVQAPPYARRDPAPRAKRLAPSTRIRRPLSESRLAPGARKRASRKARARIRRPLSAPRHAVGEVEGPREGDVGHGGARHEEFGGPVHVPDQALQPLHVLLVLEEEVLLRPELGAALHGVLQVDDGRAELHVVEVFEDGDGFERLQRPLIARRRVQPHGAAGAFTAREDGRQRHWAFALHLSESAGAMKRARQAARSGPTPLTPWTPWDLRRAPGGGGDGRPRGVQGVRGVTCIRSNRHDRERTARATAAREREARIRASRVLSSAPS